MAHSVSLVDSQSSAVASRMTVPVVSPVYSETPALRFVLAVTVPNSGDNISVVVPCALKVIGATAHKVGVSAAADTVQLFDAGNALSSPISLTAADGTLVAAAGIAHAYATFAAGDILTVDPTKVADCACVLYVECIAV